MAQQPISPRIEKFTHLLETVGFENAPFAWHVSGMPIDVEEFTDLIAKEESE
jgi:hypothetical protein